MTRFEKRLLWSSTAAVAGTGFAILWMKYTLEPVQPWDVINHPLQPLALKLHILAAPFLVFGIGLVATRHIWRHYREQVAKGRRTGITSAAVAAPMVLSGYLIQAITHVGWLRAMVWAHVAVSIVFTIGMVVHALATRVRSARASTTHPARRSSTIARTRG